MNHNDEAYPLRWPTGWPRTGQPSRARIGGISLFRSRDELERELRLLGATSIVLSTNIPLRLDGLPYSGAREPADRGAAVYFNLRGQPRVLAADRWDRVADNIVAIARHISAMRGQIRWGVGSIDQAFSGYKALTAVDEKKPWHVVLGTSPQATADEVRRRRDELLRIHHPDRGGDAQQAAEIIDAYERATSGNATA